MSDLRTPSKRRILLVEDEYFIADDLRRALERNGATVLGPVASAGDALDLIAATAWIDAALLDIHLDGEGPVYPVADALQARHVPFVFVTGYDQAVIPQRFAAVRHFEKPCDIPGILSFLFG